jgi:UDP-N-acetylmuramoyl-tripeptide--D-alanyl-D-alanine ligase
MPELKLREIAGIVGGEVMGKPLPMVSAAGYSIDTRLVKKGDLFFALKGEARDGHEFVKDAYGKGAAGAVVERVVQGVPPEFGQIVVPSVLEALQKIASHVRSLTRIPVVAITGSNGKTTTKEMVAHLLATRMVVKKSPGNFNNHIGLPLSILGLEKRDEVLVVEMGSNHRGEIARLCEIAKPQVGAVTNIGRAHIGLFGSIEAIAAEKTDLVRSLGPDGRAVVNADDQALMAALEETGVAVTRFGIDAPAEFRASDVRMTDGLGAAFTVKGSTITLGSSGIHNVYNALAAIAAASLFGVSVDEAARALPGYQPMRMRVASYGGITLIDDTYNANPDSVAAALDVLSLMRAARRVFIMGEMLELGPASERLHREVGSYVAASGIDLFIGIGGFTRKAVEEAMVRGMKPVKVLYFDTKADAKQALQQAIKQDDVVLVKASRMAGLEEISDFLKTNTVAGRI